MTNKIEVKICMGTTCFIMCNSELQEIEQEINPKVLPFLEITGAPCLGVCKDAQYHRVPCALIEGKIIENITKNELINKIEKTVLEKHPEVTLDE